MAFEIEEALEIIQQMLEESKSESGREVFNEVRDKLKNLKERENYENICTEINNLEDSIGEIDDYKVRASLHIIGKLLKYLLSHHSLPSKFR